MDFPIQKLAPGEFPELLREINDPPKKLFVRGELPDSDKNKFLCVVGSRKFTSYGRKACEKLITGLAGAPVVIVSGLALGIDAIAHKAALKAGLKTIAVPGSGLNDDVLYPKTNYRLAPKILNSGGALLSEFEPDFQATPWAFPKRNRIMAGLSHATFVIQATQKSGTLITSRLATEYNRDVLTIPGSIFASSSAGPHMLIRLGATPITSSADILEELDIVSSNQNVKSEELDLTNAEKQVLEMVSEPIAKDELIRELDIKTHEAQILISRMELKSLIEEKMGKVQRM